VRRALFEPEHESFRDSVRTFLAKRVLPHYPDWERAGIVPRELFSAVGELGLFAVAVPEEFGGAGLRDFRYAVVTAEEAARAGVAPAMLGPLLQANVCLPYFLHQCSPQQQARWLPGIASGELITAVAMTEPGAGSDLAGIRTSAVRDGERYVVNGAKTFITNGINADLVITAVRTDPASRHHGLSLLVVERDTPGFGRRNLDKVGMHAQDTAELSFSDARVPVANLLGAEGEGFAQLVANLPQERLGLAVDAVAGAAAALTWTLDYVRQRTAFGRPIGSYQNTRFRLAEIATEVDVTRSFVDRCVLAHEDGDLSAVDAAKAKWWATEMQSRVIDACVQLHGGYGYMLEYPIARAFVDSRVHRIYGGTTEIMKEIIGRDLGLG
jgi:alkylation response protein AidB-like acyl-CoA dehydrogenase